MVLSIAILSMNAKFTANTPITDTETINRNAILISESPPSDICPIFETGETGNHTHYLINNQVIYNLIAILFALIREKIIAFNR